MMRELSHDVETESDLTGAWFHVRSENYEQFLQLVGVPYFVRKMISKLNPKVTISQEGPVFKIHTVAGYIWNQSEEYNIGDEREITLPRSDIVMKCSSEWNGQCLIARMEPKEPGKGVKQNVYRQLQGDQMVMTIETDTLTAKRYFKRET